MRDLEITITSDGTVLCLATDADLDLRAVGTLHVRRASSVEFDDAQQQWHVTLPNGRDLGLYPTRGEAIDREVDVLSTMIDNDTIEEVWQ